MGLTLTATKNTIMKPYPLLILTFLCLTTLASAQRTEVGILRGFSAYSGDIHTSEALPLGQLKSSFAAFGRFYITEKTAIRPGILLANIAATDESSNLSFSSPVFETQLVAEHHIWNSPESRFGLYFFGGLALFHFNPTGGAATTNPDLQSLAPTDQIPAEETVQNGNWQVSLPFGAGAKYYLSPRMSLGLELGARKTFTDFLDNTGGSENLDGRRDWYFVGGVTATYRLF